LEMDQMTSNGLRMTGAIVAAIAAAGVSTLAAIAAEPAAVPAAPAAAKVAPVEAAPAPAEEAVEAAPAADAAPEAAAEAAPVSQPAVPAPEKAAAAPAAAPKAGDLALGAIVVGADGKEVGKVNRVRTGASGAVSEIHVMTSGKQGIVAVPGDRIASGGANVKLSLTSDEVSKLPPLGGGNG
jgi:pyruvate dehydrogenase E2 component (dihydrolipoamide acetyltransferase)